MDIANPNTQAYPVSIDTTQTQESEPVSIDTGNYVTPMPPQIASQRASKAIYGLSDQVPDKTFQDYQDASAKGQEEELRKYVASTVDNNKQQQLQVAMTKADTPEQFDAVARQVFSTKTTDPRSVLEEAFSVKYVNSIYEVNGRAPQDLEPYTWLNDVVKNIPDQAKAITESGIDVVRKYQYSIAKEEEAKAIKENQSWPGYIGDTAKTLFPGYTSVKMRGNVKGTDFVGDVNEEGAPGLLGANLEDQRKVLYRLPWDDYKTEYDRIFNRLKDDNPRLAAEFSHAMSGTSPSEQAITGLFEAVDIATLGSIAKGVAPAKNIVLYKQFKKAVADTAESVKNVELQAPKVAAADGVGDLKEAAIQKTTTDMVSDLGGVSDPAKRAIDGLTSNYQLHIDNWRATPGRYGAEISTRVEAIINNTKNSFTNALENMYRVNRIPAAAASEDVIRLATEEIKGKYTGLDNAVLNVSLRDELPTNRRMFDITIGTSEGEFFKDAGVAAANARLNGIVLRPTVSSKLYELNKNVAGLNAELKVAPEPMKPEVLVRLANAKTERDAFVKQYPEANKNTDVIPGTAGADIVEQKGLGWFIQRSVPFEETQDFVRARLLTTPLNTTGEYRAALKEGVGSTALPPSWFNGWATAIAGRIRTPEETLSIAENAQRKIATHGPGVLLDLVRDTSKPISNIPRKYWNDFDRFIRAGQKEIDPETGLPGRFYKNGGEVEDWYQRSLGRFPEKEEVEAYVAWRTNVETDRVLRDIAQIRNKSRLGVEQHSVSYMDINGKKVASPFFDGILRNDFPGGKENTIVIMGDKVGQERIVRSNEIPEAEAAKYRQEVLSNARKVIEVHDPEARPLNGFGSVTDERVRYVVTKRTPETKPLDWIQTPTRGGGHLIPDYEHYIKQAIIRVENIGGKVLHWYEGDATLMPIANKAMGQDVIDRMHAVNDLLRAGREEEAKDLATVGDRALPMDWDTYRGWYKDSYAPDGTKVPARLDLKQQFRVVSKDKTIVDIDKTLEDKYRYIDQKTGENANSFRDGTKQGSIARMNQVEFTGPRDTYDLMTVNNKGTHKNPIYNYEPAEYLDPITSMNRGLSKIINSTFMDDYKNMAIEHWIQMARRHLVASDSELADAPFRFFNKPVWKSDMPWKDWSILMSNREKIKDFIGRPSIVDTALNSITKELREGIYKTSVPYISAMELPNITDPMQFLRAATYHAKMGLYSVPQFFTQAMTFSNVYALSPLHAPGGAMAMLMHGWLAVNSNPEIIKTMDTLASKFKMPGHASFKPGEFTEAYNELKSSGFASVGGEHAYLDTPLSNKLISNGFDTFLDWGTVPFKTGAATTRVSSWYTSYLEYRASNPTGAIDRAAREEILSRAALLDHNMSRASNTPLHTGIFAPFGQFLAYSMRLSEMMTGKRLDPLEKARLFGVSSVLYGLPVGGLGLYGFPISDYIRKQALEGGYVVGDKPLSTFIMEGLPSLIVGAITGQNYNFSKFGTKGIDPLGEMLGGDKTFLNIFAGASGTTMVNQLKNMSGFWNATMSYMRSNMGLETPDTRFRYKAEDFMDMFKEINTANIAWRGIYAARFGDWLTKNETVVEKGVSLKSAIFMTLSGLTTQQQSDAYLMQNSIKTHDEANKYAESRFKQEYHRAWVAGASGDENNFKDYLRRANAWLVGYPQEKIADVYAHAYSKEQDLISQTKMDFYINKVPGNPGPSILPNMSPSNPTNTRLDAFQRSNRLEQQK